MSVNVLSLPLEIVPGTAMPDPAHPAWHGWLTDAELAYCYRLQRADEHLGARALAKRAVARALLWPHEVPWEDVEIRRDPGGPPTVVLGGALDDWRRELELPVPGVSLTHAAGHAAATAWLPDWTLSEPCAEAG